MRQRLSSASPQPSPIGRGRRPVRGKAVNKFSSHASKRKEVKYMKDRLLTNYRERQEPARELRRGQTEIEKILWTRLRNRRLNGLKFRRQFPIGRFFADFCCIEKKFVVEIDGSQHADMTAADAQRTSFYRARRFSLNSVLEQRNHPTHRFAVRNDYRNNPSPNGERGDRHRRSDEAKAVLRLTRPTGTLSQREREEVARRLATGGVSRASESPQS